MSKLIPVFIFCLFLTLEPLAAQDPFNNDTNTARTYEAFSPRPDIQTVLQKTQYFLDINDYQEAVQQLDKALASNPNSAQILLKRAEVLTMLGRVDEAEEDMKRAERYNPTASLLFGYEGDGSILSVLAVSDDDDLEELAPRNRIAGYYKFIDENYQTEGVSDDELTGIEDVLNEVNNANYPAADELTVQLLKKYPNSAAANDLSGMLLMRKGNYKDAKAAFTKAVKADKTFAVGYYNLGRIAAFEKDFKAADAYYQKAIDLEDNLMKAYFKRARLRQMQGMNEAALADYDKVIEKYGNLYPEAYLNRSYLHRQLGNFDLALTDLNRVIENDRLNNPELLIPRGNLYMVFNRPKEAIADYTTVITKSLDPAEAYYNRGLAFLTIADFTSACADLEKSVRAGYAPAQEMIDQYCGN